MIVWIDAVDQFPGYKAKRILAIVGYIGKESHKGHITTIAVAHRENPGKEWQWNDIFDGKKLNIDNRGIMKWTEL